jgi:hypothetical protein
MSRSSRSSPPTRCNALCNAVAAAVPAPTPGPSKVIALASFRMSHYNNITLNPPFPTHQQ